MVARITEAAMTGFSRWRVRRKKRDDIVPGSCYDYRNRMQRLKPMSISQQIPQAVISGQTVKKNWNLVGGCGGTSFPSSAKKALAV